MDEFDLYFVLCFDDFLSPGLSTFMRLDFSDGLVLSECFSRRVTLSAA